MSFSSEEQSVLGYFFTNLDKPIFFAKNMPPEIWALMQARYSRSTSGMRESFLEILKEDPANYAEIAGSISSGSSQLRLERATEKASNFLSKWALGYGHASVAEGAVVGVALEGVSILATKVIEDNRLCSFTEKSTRYVLFNKDSFYIDPVILDSRFASQAKELVATLFETYQKIQPQMLEYVKSVAPCKPGEEAAWERACKARVFDSARYLLPACTKTNMGWTLNARNLAHAISKMLSHPLGEMQELGSTLKAEGTTILPSLLKYANKSDYLAETNAAMPSIAGQFASGAHEEQANRVTLVEGPVEGDDVVVAAILYRYSQLPFEQIKQRVKQMSAQEKEKVFDEFVSRMGEHDAPLRELEHVGFTWDIAIDYGAFRDLQRHRICTQTNPLLTTFLGYETPPDVINSGVREEFDSAMKQADALYREMVKELPLHAQYLVPLGYRKRLLLSANLREMYYLVRLRSGPQGHFSYRRIAQSMYCQLKEKYPLLAKYIQCTLSDEELGRLKAEVATEEKRRRSLTEKI